MNKKVSLGVMIAVVLLAVALTISGTMVLSMRHFSSLVSDVGQRQAMYDYIDEIDSAARKDYTIDEEKLRAALANGYIDGLEDPYAAYLSAAEYQEVQSQLAGNRTGFGLTVTVKGTELIVSSVDGNSPAALSGIEKGNVLTAIDGEAVTGASYTLVQSKINSSDKLIVTVKQGETTTAVELSSNTYTVVSVTGRLINDTIGYIRIAEFNNVTPLQFKNVYNELTQQGAIYFLFDVRNNAGGQLSAAQEILDYLLPRGPYADCKKKGETATFSATDTYEMTAPSVTLINGNTVGEAELFAGVLQDLSKTRLVGTSTQGKAVVQEYATIQSDKGAVRLSTGVLYRIQSGETWKDIGLMPDQTADLAYDKQMYFDLLTDEEDTQLQAAIQLLASNTYLPAVNAEANKTTTTAATATTTTAVGQ